MNNMRRALISIGATITRRTIEGNQSPRSGDLGHPSDKRKPSHRPSKGHVWQGASTFTLNGCKMIYPRNSVAQFLAKADDN